MIATRVSNLSSSRHIFENECKVYNHALIHAGYRQELQYNDNNGKVKNRKSRKRNILWYNPPFSQNVKTNVAKTFLALLTKHFEKSELNNFFNRKTVKVSYSCMANMEAVLKGHNQRILTQLESTKNSNCNCQKGKPSCPLRGNCQAKSVVYKANIKTEASSISYIGQTANSFKERYRNHLSSFNHRKYENNTHLSKYIWSLKNKNMLYDIDWSIIANARSYNPNSQTCSLCQTEKVHILQADPRDILNKRNELMKRCIHSQKYRLSKT